MQRAGGSRQKAGGRKQKASRCFGAVGKVSVKPKADNRRD